MGSYKAHGVHGQQTTNDAFAEPAMEALKKWKFKPAKKDGEIIGRFDSRVAGFAERVDDTAADGRFILNHHDSSCLHANTGRSRRAAPQTLFSLNSNVSYPPDL